jgi:DNA repair protein RadD
MAIRDYQRKWLDDIYAAWNSGARNIIATLPTGAGKTFCFVTAIRERGEPAVIVAHRQELVSQASLALNREKLPHSIEAPRETVRTIIQAHMATHGESFYSPGATVHVAGVHTLAARADKIRWARDIRLVVVDEAHHVTTGGIWHDAIKLFENAVGLFPTGHCLRADGAGLGRGADGLGDALVTGPSARCLIGRGFLSDYRIALPPADIDLSDVPVGTSGDFSPVRLAAAVHASRHLVGDVAGHYVRRAAGKLGLTFAVDIVHAGEIRAAYAALGVPSEIITGKTPVDERADLMRRFRERRILQLVSVDVLGEGTDVPDVEVVSMARPTASFQLYAQQLGRMLRVSVAPDLLARWDTFTDAERLAHIAAGPKPFSMLHDHVGNFTRHYQQRGMPCAPQRYSLARAERKARNAPSDAIPLRTCLNPECFQPSPRTLIVCPHCGTPAPAPAGRALPENVDGDLVLLDPAAMAALIGEVARVDGPPPNVSGSKPPVARGILRNHDDRQKAQNRLRERMAVWGGWRIHVHGDQRQAQREFFHKFGIDVMTAQTLGVREAVSLYERVHCDLHANNVHSTETPTMDGLLDMTPYV